MVIKQIGEVICRLKGEFTVLLTEHNLNMALTVADDIHIISEDSVVWEGRPGDLRNDEDVEREWLGF